MYKKYCLSPDHILTINAKKTLVITMITKITWNAKCYEMYNVKCHEMLILLLDIWPQAETPGVTHFWAYHRIAEDIDGLQVSEREGGKRAGVRSSHGTEKVAGGRPSSSVVWSGSVVVEWWQCGASGRSSVSTFFLSLAQQLSQMQKSWWGAPPRYI